MGFASSHPAHGCAVCEPPEATAAVRVARRADASGQMALVTFAETKVTRRAGAGARSKISAAAGGSKNFLENSKLFGG